MPTQVHNLSEAQRAFVFAFARGDAARIKAIYMRYFGERPLRECVRYTGIAKSTINDLAVAFGAVYDQWAATNAFAEQYEAEQAA